MLFDNLFGEGQLTACKRQSAANAQMQSNIKWYLGKH